MDKKDTTGWVIAGVVFAVVVIILLILYFIKREADKTTVKEFSERVARKQAKVYPYDEKASEKV